MDVAQEFLLLCGCPAKFLFRDSIDYLVSRDRICLLADKFFGLLEPHRFTLFFVISRKDFGASRSTSYNFQFAGISPY
jgi:hypothetical protein